MAIATAYSTCTYCGEAIALRAYAHPRPVAPDADPYGVKLWTAGNGRYPGDQRVCEAHILADDIGSYGYHEPGADLAERRRIVTVGAEL